MEIKFFCTIWGSNHADFDSFLNDVIQSGYDGVEMSLPLDPTEKATILDALTRKGLLFIAQHWETVSSDFEEHKLEYRSRLVNLATANPLFINSQTGKDFFTFKQNAALIQIASEVSEEYNVKIIHETHRAKFSFAAHITEGFLNRLPDLRLALDLSHWCNVAESFLEDQESAVDLAISRADHIHARVGFSEGPQIPDPRVPEWKEAVDIHIGWWKRIIEKRKSEQIELFTITPEFGPYPYMTIMPYTQQPISNQWEINVYMKDMLKSIFLEI